jgi:transcriptional regulator with GAF, ATPase, and Fis domain
LRPAKRARRLNQSLVAFRETVEKILPLVQSASALNDPVALPDAVAALVRFLVQITHAQEGVLLVRHYDPMRSPPETCRAFDSRGRTLTEPLVPFARSIASAALSREEPSVLSDLDKTDGAMELQPFERGRHALLVAPLAVGAGVQAVLELFDPLSGRFSADDQRLVQVAADLGAELLRHALGQRQSDQLLLDAVTAALQASEQMAQSLDGTAEERLAQPPPAPVLEQLREGLRNTSEGDRAAADATLRLVEAIRVLARRHGPAALDHCERLVESVRRLLDAVTV